MVGTHRVLIVASQITREVDGVIDRLRDQGFEIVRFAPCQFPGMDRYSWRPGSDAGLNGPQAAWLCDFSGWSVEAELTGLEREVALAETTAFTDGLFLALETRWLNTPAAIRSASRKLYQLAVATRLGIAAPQTCVTNDPDEARQFCEQQGDAIAKALATGFVRYGAQTLKTYTRAVGPDTDKIFESLAFGPLIFQRRLRKKAEIRAVVIDQEVVLVRADLTGLDDDVVDMRMLDYEENRSRFSHCTDRPDIAAASLRIVSALDLGYGCIDWAVEGDGHPIFLECNPLGSFKWFEHCSGQDITGLISRSLEFRCGR